MRGENTQRSSRYKIEVRYIGEDVGKDAEKAELYL